MKRTSLILMLMLVISSMIGLHLTNENKLLRYDVKRQSENIRVLTRTSESIKFSADSQRIQTQSLLLKNKELEMYKEEAEVMIKELGYKIKSLESMSKTKANINIPIKTNLESRLNKLDSLPAPLPLPQEYIFNFKDSYVKASGVILGDSITLNINTNVTLNQIVVPIPKHKFLWFKWGIKGFEQVVWTDNPYIKLEYTEHIIFKN